MKLTSLERLQPSRVLHAGRQRSGRDRAGQPARRGRASPPPIDPLDPKPPHVTPRAKSVIWCFMEGGPSHVDLFDPKPALEKYIGQQVPPSFHPETLGVTGFGTNKNGLMPLEARLQATRSERPVDFGLAAAHRRARRRTRRHPLRASPTRSITSAACAR